MASATSIADFVKDLEASYNVLSHTTDILVRRAHKLQLLLTLDGAFNILSLDDLDQMEQFMNNPQTTEQIFHMSNVYKAGIEALKYKLLQLRRLQKRNPQDKELQRIVAVTMDFLQRAKRDFSNAKQAYGELQHSVQQKVRS